MIVLDGVDFDFFFGEMVVLFGVLGFGKLMLMCSLIGFVLVFVGLVCVVGYDVMNFVCGELCILCFEVG